MYNDQEIQEKVLAARERKEQEYKTQLENVKFNFLSNLEQKINEQINDGCVSFNYRLNKENINENIWKDISKIFTKLAKEKYPNWAFKYHYAEGEGYCNEWIHCTYLGKIPGDYFVPSFIDGVIFGAVVVLIFSVLKLLHYI